MHRQRGAQVLPRVVVAAEGAGQCCEVVVDGAAVSHASAVDEVVASQGLQPVVHLGPLRVVADRDDGFGDDHGHPAVVAADPVSAILFERVAGEDRRRRLTVAFGDEQHGSDRWPAAGRDPVSFGDEVRPAASEATDLPQERVSHAWRIRLADLLAEFGGGAAQLGGVIELASQQGGDGST